MSAIPSIWERPPFWSNAPAPTAAAPRDTTPCGDCGHARDRHYVLKYGGVKGCDCCVECPGYDSPQAPKKTCKACGLGHDECGPTCRGCGGPTKVTAWDRKWEGGTRG